MGKPLPVLLTRSEIEAIYWECLNELKKKKPRIALRIASALNVAKTQDDRAKMRAKCIGKGKFHA